MVAGETTNAAGQAGPIGSVGSIEPTVQNISIKGTLLGTFDVMAGRLSTLQMFFIRATINDLTIIRVESRNIQRKPYLFMIFRFEKDRMSVDYSIAHSTSEKLRRLYVLRNLVAVLSLVTDIYEADSAELFQHLDSSMDEVLGTMSQEYGTMLNQYDSIRNEYRQLKRLNIELTNSNKNLAVGASLLKAENDELKIRLKQLETYSDDSLMALVEEWLEAHEGLIDINEFAENYKISPPRVEQILNKMVSLGYIEMKG